MESNLDSLIEEYQQDITLLRAKLVLLRWYSFKTKRDYENKIQRLEKLILKIRFKQLDELFMSFPPMVKLLIIGMEILFK